MLQKVFYLIVVSVLLTLGTPVYAGDKGMLKIVTDPGKAQIYINGKRKGTSPAVAG